MLMEIKLVTLKDTARLAACVAKHIRVPSTVWLQGQLGVGKTAFCRGFVHAFDAKARVKSPTYPILESYSLPGLVIHHFDFYRITETDELEHIGIRDYFTGQTICLIEWPENACGISLPAPQLTLHLDYEKAQQSRCAILQAEEDLLQSIQQDYG